MNIPLPSSEMSGKCRCGRILLCTEAMLGHPAAGLCQVPFRAAAARLALLQAGALGVLQTGQLPPELLQLSSCACWNRVPSASTGWGAGKQRLFDPLQWWRLRHCTQVSADDFSLHCSFCPGEGWGLRAELVLSHLGLLTYLNQTRQTGGCSVSLVRT